MFDQQWWCDWWTLCMEVDVADNILEHTKHFLPWAPGPWSNNECRPLLLYLKEAIHPGLLAEKATMPIPVQPMSKGNSWSGFAGNVLPIHHTAQTLHRSTSSFSHHWRTSNENTSDVMTMWKPSIPVGATVSPNFFCMGIEQVVHQRDKCFNCSGDYMEK
jgi:hypothetical protein